MPVHEVKPFPMQFRDAASYNVPSEVVPVSALSLTMEVQRPVGLDAWPIGKEILQASCEISFDGGSVWEPFFSFETGGGDLTLPYSSIQTTLPPERGQRRLVRATIKQNKRLKADCLFRFEW